MTFTEDHQFESSNDNPKMQDNDFADFDFDNLGGEFNLDF
ncbi:hypothetical protein Bhyg_02367 [Pseudolycoriella hygida]|uniref:Uncharacterized protein n=1 Tax=Pseudolycoriella hygida TaxID=35572 RepID=A0A9Q0NBB7_9DIPT|nr:hypothetical protein Bhyg_05453 [Pseudolycoriella hygida]KAJ6647147.1 hypothetical protein Bhyg_02367 [Pseudolycoriella hygida]